MWSRLQHVRGGVFGETYGHLGFINTEKLPDSTAMKRAKKKWISVSVLTVGLCVSDLLACTRRLEGGVQLGRQGHHRKSFTHSQIPQWPKMPITAASPIGFERQACRWRAGAGSRWRLSLEAKLRWSCWTFCFLLTAVFTQWINSSPPNTSCLHWYSLGDVACGWRRSCEEKAQWRPMASSAWWKRLFRFEASHQ